MAKMISKGATDQAIAEYLGISERTKSDRAHKVPLFPWALEILESIPRQENIDYVFCGRPATGNPVSGFARAAQRARGLSKVPGWRPHDLRRTVRTRLGQLGIPSHIAELVLNYTVKGLQAVYDRHDYEKEKRKALNQCAAASYGLLEDSQAEVA